ncbi:MAG: hypothetical protein SFT68_04410 [Rickettsiaceae bacterium]|nr:hypothetical protein [Rickettsiaceae bacterium]
MSAQQTSIFSISFFVKILLLITGVVLFSCSRHTFIFFSAAILPSIATFFADRAPHKCASATIATFNLIGIVPYLKKIYFSSSFDETAKDIIIEPYAWLSIYATTLVGCFLYFIIPEIILQFHAIRAQMKINNLIERRDQISKEWNINIENNNQDDLDF